MNCQPNREPAQANTAIPATTLPAAEPNITV
ncbi:hypothetical protein D030_2020A, partial [Vibrio parahaemolyticus AQ3810]